MTSRKNITFMGTLMVLAFFAMVSFSTSLYAKQTALHAKIEITTANRDDGVVGTYKGKDTITFSIIEDKATGDRVATFKGKKKKQMAKIVAHQNGEYEFNVREIQWEKGESLTKKQQKLLKNFGKTELARAIIEVAAFASWEIPSDRLRETLLHRVTAMELYDEISPFYSRKNKKLTQPETPKIPETCPLKLECDLMTNEALFGCGTGKEKKGVLVLLDGLPQECRLGE